MENKFEVFTIGHSNHSINHFLSLLKINNIDVLVDIRSSPQSKYATQFNRDELTKSIKAIKLKYLYLGDQLGGRPKGELYYDLDGRVRYDLWAKTNQFLSGISRLKEGIKKFRVVIMCSEENPTECHRRLLVGRVIREDGIRIIHIRGNGVLMDENDLMLSEKANGQQSDFFKEEVNKEWKSVRSVLHKKAPDNSSKYSEITEYGD